MILTAEDQDAAESIKALISVVSDLQEKFASLSDLNPFAKLTVSMKDLQDQATQMGTDLKEAAASAGEMGGAAEGIAAAADAMGETTTAATALGASARSAADGVTALRDALQKMASDVYDFTGGATSAEDFGAALDADARDVNASVDAMGALRGSGADLTPISGALAEMSAAADEASKYARGLQSSLTELQGYAAKAGGGLAEPIQELSADLGTANDAAATLRSTMETLQSALADVGDSITTVNTGLVAQSDDANTAAQSMRTLAAADETAGAAGGAAGGGGAASGGLLGATSLAANSFVKEISGSLQSVLMTGLNLFMADYGLSAIGGAAWNTASISMLQKTNNMTAQQAQEASMVLGAGAQMSPNAAMSLLGGLAATVENNLTSINGVLGKAGLVGERYGITPQVATESPWNILQSIQQAYMGLVNKGLGSEAMQLLSDTGTSSLATAFGQWGTLTAQAQQEGGAMSSGELNQGATAAAQLEVSMQKMSLEMDKAAADFAPLAERIASAVGAIAGDFTSGKGPFKDIEDAFASLDKNLGPITTGFIALAAAMKGASVITNGIALFKKVLGGFQAAAAVNVNADVVNVNGASSAASGAGTAAKAAGAGAAVATAGSTAALLA